MRKLRNKFNVRVDRRQRSHYVCPPGGTRACLCPDLTYHVECCDGSLHAQGVGITEV